MTLRIARVREQQTGTENNGFESDEFRSHFPQYRVNDMVRMTVG